MTKDDVRMLRYLFELHGYDTVRGQLDTFYDQAERKSREDRQVLTPSLLDRYCRYLKCERKDLNPVTLMTMVQFGYWIESGL